MNTVVYRAMISLQVPASIIDADDIVMQLSNWVEDEPSVSVNSLTLKIDSNCPAMLESFNSDDCEGASSSSSSSPSSAGIIIGAAVAATAVVLLLITVVVMIIIYYRRKSSYRYKACCMYK